ncbi:hypothetical protein G195_010714 [Phytophthora kernoviae 00238/432]|uniref:Uncharacterized protein n=1 Tax=Phytophthora kernoviae 00238/432 TaxID=1284355 RepID=A0A8J4RTJ7_9STRA|nr:hypothetical protein G195_010714 [Phytophthora kernoviae 00238/432]
MGAGRQLLLASPSVFDMLEARVNARFGELKLAIDESHRLMAKTDTEHVNISYEGDSRVRSVSFSRAKLLPFEEATSQLDESIATDAGAPLSSREQGILESFLEQTDLLEHNEAAMLDVIKPSGRKRLVDSPDGKSLLAKKSNPSWKRRRDELRRLRIEAQTMQNHVTFLTLKKTYEQLFDSSNQSEGLGRWKDPAMNEKLQCEKAKAENEQLKEKLQNCVQTCNLLQTALTAAETQHKELLTANTATTQALQFEMQTNHNLDLENSIIFNNLEHSADARLNELDALLYEAYISTFDPDADLVQIHRAGSEETDAMVEFKRSRLMPFTVDKTSSAAWDLMQLGVTNNNCAGRVIRRADDLVASKERFTYMLKGGGNVEIRSHCLMKRVQIPTGTIVLVEATNV